MEGRSSDDCQSIDSHLNISSMENTIDFNARNVIPLPVDQPTDTPILGFLAEVALKRHYEDMQKQNDATNGSNINQDQTHQTSKPEQKNPSTPLFTTSVTDEKKVCLSEKFFQFVNFFFSIGILDKNNQQILHT